MNRLVKVALAVVVSSLLGGGASAQIVNGNFSSGNSGVTSQYTYSSAPGTPIVPCFPGYPPAALDAGCYAIPTLAAGNHPNDYHTGFTISADHTGDLTGGMLLANGAPSSSYVWQQTVTVTAATTYLFTTWVASAWNDPAPANLQIQVDTTAGCASATSFVGIGTVNALSNTTWVKNYGTFKTGTSTSACIRILNQNTASSGNDFALDDLSLSNDPRVPLETRSATVSTPKGTAGSRNVVTLDVTAGTSPVDAASVDLDPPTAGRQTSYTYTNASGSVVFTVNNAGLVTYTPSANFVGTATCSWRVSTTDAPPVPSAVAVLSVLVSPAPTVTAITPESGPVAGGTPVTITGTGFLASPTVTIGGTAATSVTRVSATSITATTPAGTAGAKNVVVTNTDTQSGTLVGGYTYVAGPTVTAIIPESGSVAGGTAVTITGTGFLPGPTVTIGGTPATSVTRVSATSITATTPAGTAGAKNVVVTNTDLQFGTLVGGYIYVAGPTVTAITPESGPVAGGTPVTITGTGFLPGPTVTIGGSPATSVTRVSATSITATTPAGTAGAKNVVVTNTDLQSGTLAGGYTYVAGPTVTAITPESGPVAGGTPVTITGTGFLASPAVTIGGTAATSVTRVSSTSITATTPAGTAGARSVVVTNTDLQSGTLAGGYTYVAAPTAWSMNPTGGPSAGGTAVTIQGTGFLAGAVVTFGWLSATVTSLSSTSITAIHPSSAAGNVTVTVRNPDGQSASVPGSFSSFNPAGCWPEPSKTTSNMVSPCTPAVAGPPMSGKDRPIGIGSPNSTTMVFPPLWTGSSESSNKLIFFYGAPPVPVSARGSSPATPTTSRAAGAAADGCYRYKSGDRVMVSLFGGMSSSAAGGVSRNATAGPTITTTTYRGTTPLGTSQVQYVSSRGNGVFDRMKKIGGAEFDLPLITMDTNGDGYADYMSLPWAPFAAAVLRDNFLGNGDTPGPTPQIWLPLADTDGDGYGDAVVFDPAGTGSPSPVFPKTPPLLPNVAERTGLLIPTLGEWGLFALALSLAAAGWLALRRSVA